MKSKKGMDIFSEAGVKQTYSYLQHGLVRKKQQVLSELCFFIVYTEEEILILNKNTRLHMCPMNSDVGSKMADRS